jgi:hypothetical protein
MKRIALFFLAVALLYAGAGLLPDRTLAPLDIPFDMGAWKPDPTERVRVSNSLLSDVIVQFIPWDREVLRLLSNGELPWVNRFAGEGGPLFANPQTALFSPFTWPRLLFGLDGWAIMALLKILAAAFSAYWLARELDVSPRQAALSGVVFATAGYMTVWLLFPHTGVFALLPGLAAAAFRLMKHPSMHNATLVILFGSLCTAGGHPETLFVGVIGIWIFLVWEAERRRDLGIGAVVPSSIGALLGFLLLAFHIAPFLVILSQSYAEVLRPELSHPFRFWAMVSQVLPGILGTPLRGELDLTAVPMAESFNMRVGAYVGAIVLLCIALAWRGLSATLKRGIVIGTIALIVSWYPPGISSVVRNVPVVRLLALQYAAILFVLFAAIAAGPALAIVATRKRRKVGAALILAGLVAVVAGIVPLIPATKATLAGAARSGVESLRSRGHLQQPPEVYEERLDFYLSSIGKTALRRVAVPGVFWLVAGAALAFPVPRRSLLLAIAAAGELFSFGIGFNPAVRMTDVPPAPGPIAAIQQLDPERRFRLAAHFEIFPANLGTLYQVREAISYDVLNTKDEVERLLPAGHDPLMHTFNPILSPQEVERLGAIGVRWVLSRHDVAGARRVAGLPEPAVGVYEIENAVPVTMPPNRSPAGLAVGAIISLLAVAVSAIWLRLYLMAPPGAELRPGGVATT